MPTVTALYPGIEHQYTPVFDFITEKLHVHVCCLALLFFFKEADWSDPEPSWKGQPLLAEVLTPGNVLLCSTVVQGSQMAWVQWEICCSCSSADYIRTCMPERGLEDPLYPLEKTIRFACLYSYKLINASHRIG